MNESIEETAVHRRADTRTYPLLASQRWVIFVVPVTMIVTATYVFVSFSQSEFWWWSILIMAVPLLLTVFIALESTRLRIEVNQQGLRYYSVGYVAYAPWSQVSYHPAVPSVVFDDPDIAFSPWLGWMVPVLGIFQPGRARFALSSMRVVPVRYFDDGTLDAAMSEFSPKNTKN